MDQLNEFGHAWLAELEYNFGEVDDIMEMQAENKPKIFIFYFEDFPTVGLLTAVTCGLSNASHPDWGANKPELIVTLDTTDRSWGLAAGYFASSFFNEKSFSYGDVFNLDDPISNESEMNALLAYAPSFLDRDQMIFEFSDRTVNLVGMYPLFNEEIDIYEKIGLEALWKTKGFHIYNPRRKRIKLFHNVSTGRSDLYL